MGLEIFTDGSFKGRWGSWAFIILQDGVVLCEKSSRHRNTDSNRMEFQAAIEALKRISMPSVVTLYTDSRILIENISLLSEWKSNNWLKKNNRPIPNVDQFFQLSELVSIHKISWKWVRAHSGNVHNERCDELCVLARAD